MRIVNKTALASLLGVSKSRVSQYVRAGMPVRPDGLVDADVASAWVRETVDPAKAPVTRVRARTMAASAGSHSDQLPPPLPFAWTVKATLRSAYQAAREEGLEHDQAERIGRIAALMLWCAVEEIHGLEGLLTMNDADLQLPAL